MTVPTSTFQTFQSIGNREDLSNVIYDISPMDTPFTSSIAKESSNAVYTEWQTDTLRAAAANAQVEGDDAGTAALVPTVRLGNYNQISEETIRVSGTQRSVDAAGRADDYSRAITRAGMLIKRDMEFALVQNQASSAGSASTARTSAGAESWLSTNKSHGTSGATPGFSAGIVAAPTTGTQRALTKALLDGVIQSCWSSGGDPSTIMVGPSNRTVISGFTGISTLQTDASSKGDVTLMGAVDFYKSNFGTLKVVPNRFMRDRTALILDMDYWSLSTLRNMEINPLAKTGDSDRAQLICEYTLVSRNEAASGKVADLTTP